MSTGLVPSGQSPRPGEISRRRLLGATSLFAMVAVGCPGTSPLVWLQALRKKQSWSDGTFWSDGRGWVE